ncbi:MAG TPA: hypothetical protein VKZ44_04525 [Taishania sp.]|nr:hypothetical protein [Taishania sp.]
MNDLVYLNMFRDAQTRPMVMHYFMERIYRIETLIKYAGSKEAYPLPDYASWVIAHLAKEFPERLKDHQPLIIDAFFESDNQTVLRNLSVALILLPLAEYREGELYDKLIAHLLNNDNKVALHVNCIHKLIQFAQKYPELVNEIADSIEIRLENNKQASLISASKKFYKKFKRTN